MNKLLTLITFTLFTSLALAQKLEKPKIDKLTGDTTQATSIEKIYSKHHWGPGGTDQLRIAFSKSKGNYFLGLGILTSSDYSFTLPQGSQIHFKTSNNQIITLINPSDRFSGPVEYQKGAYASLFIPITEAELSALKAQTITFIRIESDNYKLDYDIKSSDAEIIKSLCSIISR